MTHRRLMLCAGWGLTLAGAPSFLLLLSRIILPGDLPAAGGPAAFLLGGVILALFHE